MKIAVVSKADRHGGGASSVAESKVRFLRNTGIYAEHFVSWHGPENSDRVQLLYGDYSKLVRKLQKRAERVGLPDLIPFEYYLSGKRLREFDVVHFHDLSSAVSPYTLKWLSREMPVVWTFHDCSPFTGGCLYPMECKGYLKACADRCPQIGQWPLGKNYDFTSRYTAIKQKLFQSERLCPITPSQWMSDMAVSSGLLPEAPMVIPNYVDTKVFYPRSTKATKRQYGLPLDRAIILLSAGNILDPRKGTLDAIQALRSIDRDAYHLLLVGNYSPEAERELEGMGHTFTGYLGDKEALAQVYSVADLFLFPTKADNMPLVVLETMACGTPVITYDIGGLPEMVVDSQSGRLVPVGDVAAMSTVLVETLEKRSFVEWSAKCVRRANELYSVARFTDAHVDLYKSLLK